MSWFKKLSFRMKMLISVTMAGLICGIVSIVVAMYFQEIEFHRGLVGKSQTIHGRMEKVAQYVAEQGGLKGVITDYTQKYKSSNQLDELDKETILKQVPIYAAMVVGNKDAEKEQYKFRVFSNEPRNEKNKATEAELIIFNQFLSDSNLKELVTDENGIVTVYRPVRISESHGCLTCHGSPAKSPWGNGKDILGYPMEDWKDGKLHGVFAVINNVEEAHQAQVAAGMTSATPKLILFIFIGIIVALIFAASIINREVNLLMRVARSLSESGQHVNDASTKIAAASEELSQATSEQAASLEETAASMEEMSSMVAKNTENAKNTASSSQQSSQKAQEGKDAVERMMQSMEDINSSNEAIVSQIHTSNKQLVEIVSVIKEIGNKTKVINDIVFQTKLLSFNASVEAARAGEHGKGFAVVAEEVGNLAQMSGQASREISSMLGGSISKVENIVQETKSQVESLVAKGKQKVDFGIEVAKQCGDVLNEIVHNVGSVSAMASEISSASQEQSQGISEINKAMVQLDSVTQQNASTSESTARSANELSVEAQSLQSAVSELIHIITGGIEEASVPHRELSTAAPSSNVIPIEKVKAPIKTVSSKIDVKAAVGDDKVPSRDHSGFSG